jgi:class 3 adenylate cyclase
LIKSVTNSLTHSLNQSIIDLNTAWSSTREPSQVFSLLEAVYKRFDEIAKKRSVFKVETVGDCYVAAVGIPEYRSNHAVVMMRFAHDIMYAMGKTDSTS